MDKVALTIGLVCIAAAIVGGELKASGIAIPILSSFKQRIALATFGALVLAGLWYFTRPVRQATPPIAKVDAAPATAKPEPSPSLAPSSQTAPAGPAKEVLHQKTKKPVESESAVGSSPTADNTSPTTETKPTYEQQCAGSACAQGQGSTATYNQYGARELNLSRQQGDLIASAMSKYAGMSLNVTCEIQSPDVEPFTQEITRALGRGGAGMNVDPPECGGMVMGPVNQTPYPGVSMAVGQDCSSMANALADELAKLKILDKRMPIQVIPNYGKFCSLTIRSNR